MIVKLLIAMYDFNLNITLYIYIYIILSYVIFCWPQKPSVTFVDICGVDHDINPPVSDEFDGRLAARVIY